MLKANLWPMPGDKCFVWYMHNWQSRDGSYREAVVLRRYGHRSLFRGWKYPDLVDVQFDHNSKVSNGHFTAGVRKVAP